MNTLWEEGREPGYSVVALGVALALSAVALDVLATGGISWLFDLCFVALCVALALRVRPTDFFTVGVLPPLLLLGTVVLIASTRPEVFGAPSEGLPTLVLTGLAQHSLALVIGYLLSLGVLLVRRRFVADELMAHDDDGLWAGEWADEEFDDGSELSGSEELTRSDRDRQLPV